MKENFFILIQISLKFAPTGLIDNKAALVQVMAWRRIGDKPLPEPMLIVFTDAYAALGGDELTINLAIQIVDTFAGCILDPMEDLVPFHSSFMDLLPKACKINAALTRNIMIKSS